MHPTALLTLCFGITMLSAGGYAHFLRRRVPSIPTKLAINRVCDVLIVTVILTALCGVLLSSIVLFS